MTEKERDNTKSDVFLYSGFAPLIQVASLAAAHIEHLAPSATTTAATIRNGARGESGMGKTCDQDGLYPVVKIAHSNNPRAAPLVDTNVRSRII
jgi:hypothetical protein